MSPRDFDELMISLKDFDSLSIHVVIENVTAKTAVGLDVRLIGDQANTSGDQSLVVQLMEMEQDSVSLDAPARSGASGHFVRITFDVEGASSPFSFIATGIVSGVEALADDREKFTVKFTDFDRKYYDALRKLYATRQLEIERFFSKAGG